MAAKPPRDPRRRLPAIDRLLQEPAIDGLRRVYGREAVLVQLRQTLAAARVRLAEGDTEVRNEDLVASLTRDLTASLGRPVRRVLNATGIFLHTNLGRAPLRRDVADRLAPLATAGCDLELDLATGKRGERMSAISPLLTSLTGAEAALAVNNAAAALVLALSTLAAGRKVVVSRGELVEIGGSFRVPEILEAAGAELLEVGTTNRTHRRDYEGALGAAPAAILKVLPSNYRIRGFTREVETSELAALAGPAGVPLVVDEGSGLLSPRREPPFADHPSVRELVAGGADLVCSSGDKVLGGPQAGLLVGGAPLVARCHRAPLYRAVRLGRLAAVALEDTLRAVARGEAAPLDQLWPDAAVHRRRLEVVAARLGAEILPGEAFVGGGSAPDAAIPGEVLGLDSAGDLAGRLRHADPALVGYVRDGKLLLDLRTIDPRDDEELVAIVRSALEST